MYADHAFAERPLDARCAVNAGTAHMLTTPIGAFDSRLAHPFQ